MIVHGEMHHAAVVPHDEISDIPNLAGLKFGSRRVVEEIVEERSTFLTRPTDEPARKRAADV